MLAQECGLAFGLPALRKSIFKSVVVSFLIKQVLFPTVWKIHLVLDRDTFRLELDYRSIMHILVKVLSN